MNDFLQAVRKVEIPGQAQAVAVGEDGGVCVSIAGQTGGLNPQSTVEVQCLARNGSFETVGANELPNGSALSAYAVMQGDCFVTVANPNVMNVSTMPNPSWVRACPDNDIEVIPAQSTPSLIGGLLPDAGGILYVGNELTGSSIDNQGFIGVADSSLSDGFIHDYSGNPQTVIRGGEGKPVVFHADTVYGPEQTIASRATPVTLLNDSDLTLGNSIQLAPNSGYGSVGMTNGMIAYASYEGSASQVRVGSGAPSGNEEIIPNAESPLIIGGQVFVRDAAKGSIRKAGAAMPVVPGSPGAWSVAAVPLEGDAHTGAWVSVDPNSSMSTMSTTSTLSIVSTLEPADINGKGSVNVADVQKTIVEVLKTGLKVGPSQDYTPADVNCDGQTNVADTQLVIQRVLNQPWSPQVDSDGNRVVDVCVTPKP